MGSRPAGQPASQPNNDDDAWDESDGIPPPPRSTIAGSDGGDAFEIARKRLQERSTAQDAALPGRETQTDLSQEGMVSPPPGFDMHELVGRGGMGSVYRATQKSLNRVVAIKLIHSGGHASREERDRFQREAESAARLRHASIVQVHAVDDHLGVPYLVMEYVEGGTLADLMIGKPLPARAASAFVAKLADAMEVAHQAGIIHRDLKPSNILLKWEVRAEASSESQDAVKGVRRLEHAIPKVSDFGLAKQMNDGTDATRTGIVMGTPTYMAPEQAFGRAKDVGPSADIYALGAIFYELLVGRPPFVGPSAMETLELVRNEEPVSPKRLSRGIPTDIVTICLKCLEKVPSRRYDSAASLSADLNRFLRNEPIHAKPASMLDHSVKWMRRNPARTAAITSSLIASLLLIGLTIRHNAQLGAEVLRSNQSEERALEQKALAMKNFQRGYETLDDLLQQIGSYSRDSTEATQHASQLYRQALDFFYEALADADETDPEVRHARGNLLVYAGSMQFLLGNHDRAAKDLSSALQRLEPLHQADPNNLTLARHLARCHFYRASVHLRVGELSEAIALFHESLAVLGGIQTIDSEFPRLKENLAQTRLRLGDAYLAARDAEQAHASFSVAVKGYHELLNRPDGEESHRFKLGNALHAIALSCLDMRRYDEAREYLAQSESNWRSSPNFDSDPVQRGLAETCRHWGMVENHQGDFEAAIARFEQGIEIMNAVLDKRPDEPISRASIYGLLRGKAWMLSRLGEDNAMDVWQQTLQFADGDLQTHTRAEIANEYSLLGKHELAMREIESMIDESELRAGMGTWVFLARIASTCMTIVSGLEEPGSEDVSAQYAELGIRCLERSREEIETILSDPGMSELILSEQFAKWSQNLDADAKSR